MKWTGGNIGVNLLKKQEVKENGGDAEEGFIWDGGILKGVPKFKVRPDIYFLWEKAFQFYQTNLRPNRIMKLGSK